MQLSLNRGLCNAKLRPLSGGGGAIRCHAPPPPPPMTAGLADGDLGRRVEVVAAKCVIAADLADCGSTTRRPETRDLNRLGVTPVITHGREEDAEGGVLSYFNGAFPG